MDGETELKYPSYGLYGNPKDTTEKVCKWCGKNETSWQLSHLTCSHRCHAALYWKTYRNGLPMLVLLLFLSMYLVPATQPSLLFYSVNLLLIMCIFPFSIYTSWMVWVGRRLRNETDPSILERI
jgi:hypothetical protein